MNQPRELKMTKICEMCGDQYGLWRYQCPACGTHNKDREKACAAPVTQTARGGSRIRATIREHVRAKTGCIFCQAPGAKHKCAHCDEPIHRNCRGMHEPACKQFQVERQAAEAKLGVTA